MSEMVAELATRGDGKVQDISLDRYRELGGIINKVDYYDALVRARLTTHVNRCYVAQAENMAHKAGFVLENVPGHLDPITILYGVLRGDRKPDAEYFHGQMGDQRLMVEVLRMLDCPDLIQQMKSAYFNMSFK